MDELREPERPTSGAMVIRVEAVPEGFRAKLTTMNTEGEHQSVAFTEEGEVVASVRQWLRTFAPTPPDAPDEPSDPVG